MTFLDKNQRSKPITRYAYVVPAIPTLAVAPKFAKAAAADPAASPLTTPVRTAIRSTFWQLMTSVGVSQAP
jgi:hypothetical protein